MGHTDGYMSFLDDGTVCITEYPKMEIFKDDNEYTKKLEAICRDLNFRTITLYDRPLNYSIKCECDLQKERKCCSYSANGNYINFLRLNDTIILPEYTLTTLKETIYYNNINEEILSNLGFQVIKINCDALAQHGGSLRCLSFTF
jgi:agmatine/peptidylarginine deiminase